MKSKYSYFVEAFDERSRPRRFLEAFAAILKYSNYRFILDTYARTSTKCARCSVTCPVFQTTQDSPPQYRFFQTTQIGKVFKTILTANITFLCFECNAMDQFTVAELLNFL